MACGLALMLGFVLIQNFDSPYQARQHHRLLAALAHQPLHLAARLSLHPARRQPPGRAAHLRQPDGRDAARRALARRELELRDLGRDSRRHAGVRARAGEATAATGGCRLALRIAITFFDRLPVLGVLPREDARAGAWRPSSRCSASPRSPRRRTRPPGSMYTRYHVDGVRRSRRSSSGERPTPGRSPPGCPRRARVAALGLLALVDPDDVDAERQPVPLLPVLMPVDEAH